MKDLKRELNVIVDNKNLLRCKGWLQYAPLPFDSKTPIFLNDKHKLALLLWKICTNVINILVWNVHWVKADILDCKGQKFCSRGFEKMFSF